MSDDKDTCRWCKRPLQSIFGSSRVKWCPDCESDKKNKPINKESEEKPKKKPLFIDFDFTDFGYNKDGSNSD